MADYACTPYTDSMLSMFAKYDAKFFTWNKHTNNTVTFIAEFFFSICFYTDFYSLLSTANQILILILSVDKFQIIVLTIS